MLLCYYHKILFSLDFLCLWAMVSITRLLQVSPPTFLSPTRFSRGLFIVLQEMFDQPSIAVIRLFAKDNAFSKKTRFFLLAHWWSVLILLFSLYVFYGVFYSYEITNQKLHNFKLLASFQACKERIIYILLISDILNHANKMPWDKNQ